jgi:hypothetical protein
MAGFFVAALEPSLAECNLLLPTRGKCTVNSPSITNVADLVKIGQDVVQSTFLRTV